MAKARTLLFVWRLHLQISLSQGKVLIEPDSDLYLNPSKPWQPFSGEDEINAEFLANEFISLIPETLNFFFHLLADSSSDLGRRGAPG